MLTPYCPSTGPTGGAGVAAPACSWILNFDTYGFLGAMVK